MLEVGWGTLEEDFEWHLWSLLVAKEVGG
jgi:hypothetical protein